MTEEDLRDLEKLATHASRNLFGTARILGLGVLDLLAERKERYAAASDSADSPQTFPQEYDHGDPVG